VGTLGIERDDTREVVRGVPDLALRDGQAREIEVLLRRR
jgi:hypothetical protein